MLRKNASRKFLPSDLVNTSFVESYTNVYL